MIEGKVLKGKYRIEEKIGSGGMGSVYLCKNLELGNYWAAKFIAKTEEKQLLAEEEILKKLNHISLPKIVDVIYDETGTFIIESYIEGTSLKDLLELVGKIDERTVVNWAVQLCEVLNYLHSMKPYPIIYRDLKPSNIIVTEDSRIVLIDFGISVEHTKEPSIVALSAAYAAPEQFKGVSDHRSDIYSLGVTMYQLLTGQLLKGKDTAVKSINKQLTDELNEIVKKCLEKDPKDRYQSVDEIRSELNKLLNIKIYKGTRSILYRKLLVAGIILSSIITYTACFTGLYKVSLEKLSVLDVKSNLICLSAQQTGQIYIEKMYPDGHIESMNNEKMTWKSSDEKVAKVDCGRVIAMNEGTASITGRYLNKLVNIDVVVSSMEDTVCINLTYDKSYLIEKLAGSGDRDITDGDYQKAAFVGPSSIAVSPDGTIYVVDRYLRRLKDNNAETVHDEDERVDPKAVRVARDGQVYFINHEIIDKDNKSSASLFWINGDDIEELYKEKGAFYSLVDFAIDSSSNIYLLREGFVDNRFSIIKYNTKTSQAELLCDSLEDISSIAIGGSDSLYLSSSKKGVIYTWDKGKNKLLNLAGMYNQKHLIDGTDSRFFEPYRIVAWENFLYVVDRFAIRRITIENDIAVDVETIAGSTQTDKCTTEGMLGYEAGFKRGSIRDIAITKTGEIYFTDSEENVIRKIFKR